MKRILFLAVLLYCFNTQAQVLNFRKLPSIEFADEFKGQTLVIIKLQEDPEKAKKMEKKDAANYKVYKGSIDLYNASAEKYGSSLKGIFADTKYLTIDEITKMKGAELTSFAFLFPYLITTGGTSYYEDMQYDLYKKTDWALLKEDFNKLTDFSTQFNKGAFDGGKMHFQWGLFSRETTNGKSICGLTYTINFPHTEKPLTEGDLYYLYKTTKNAFEKIVKERTSDLKPTNDDAAIKNGKLYVCATNLAEGFGADALKSAYKGKVEVLSKEDFDKKLLAGEDALFLVVYPWFYVKGVTAMLAKLGYAHVIVEGKTLKAVKNYTPNKVVTGKMENISMEGDFSKISVVTTQELNKSF